MASYSNMIPEVNVLLVEHDTNHLISAKQMLEFFSYKVKCVEYASTALSMLSNGKVQFNIVMANINSPDSCTFKLLQEAYKMDLLVILMCDNDDDMMASSALEEGAFLFLKKPVKMENVMYLWQHVWREKTWKTKEKEQLREMVAYNTMCYGFATEEEIQMENVMSDDKDDVENGDKSSKKARIRNVSIEWTQELHNKFMNAAIQLGEGRCYPEEILELMNVPGLTRMQVASHLQKCRSRSWRPPEERKSHAVNNLASPKIEATKPRPRKYGSMPILTKHSEQKNLQIQENTEIIQDPQIYDPMNNNNILLENYPQLPQVEPLQDLSGYTFARVNVAAPYTELPGTNSQIVPADDLFMFGFNSVTSENLQADIDQLYYPGQISVNPNMPSTDKWSLVASNGQMRHNADPI
ncbi:unnamed protein product [Fraxinus pennsylvanica]|uniref:Uncharacterized protein n=1 Tax=Fraxinus pennsylvanica TaxID=56036 RepID=A0AAD2DJ78_9LAMI|nr:unnamed protein product [Fraxinus pennsylvanica]